MNDVIYTGQVSDLTTLVHTIFDQGPALMILEQTPNQVVEELPYQAGLKVEWLNDTISFESWPVGRVCDAEKELAWSRQEDTNVFQVVYSGLAIELPDTLHPVDGAAEWRKSDPQPYLLWGSSLPADNAEVGGGAFAEAQIPRLLHYPIGCQEEKTRIQAVVIRYDDPDGEMQYYRFQTLEPASQAEGGDL